MKQLQPNSLRQIFFYLVLSCSLVASGLFGQEKKESAPNLSTRTYRVSERFLSCLHAMVPSSPGELSQGNGKRPSGKTMLEKLGLPSPEGSAAIYNKKESTLIIRNTEAGFQIAESILDSIRSSAEQQIHIYQEWIEVDHDLFSDWLFENRLDDDGTKLRNQAQQWIKQGKATIIESVLVSGQSGQRAKVESINEYIYPTEYDPAEIPNTVNLTNGAEAPVSAVTPTAFETRNLGTTLEVDPVLSADHKIVDLNLAPEIVKLVEVVNWHNQQTDVRFQTQMPTFHTQKITTQVTARAGHYAFLGTTRPLAPADPKITRNPIVLQFVRPDVSSNGDWKLLKEE